MARFEFSKYGMKQDPTGAQIAWQIGDRRYLADVTGFYVNPITGAVILKSNHFNGEPAPDVRASFVEVLRHGPNVRS
jgi:hypothetical protein